MKKIIIIWLIIIENNWSMLEQSNNTPKIRLIDETKYYATSK